MQLQEKRITKKKATVWKQFVAFFYMKVLCASKKETDFAGSQFSVAVGRAVLSNVKG